MEITQQEVEKGWIVGKLTPEDLGGSNVVSPRFMIQQGEKARAKDDFTFSNINSTVGTSERIMLQGVDEIASMAKRMFRAGLTDLVGRTLDTIEASDGVSDQFQTPRRDMTCLECRYVG